MKSPAAGFLLALLSSLGTPAFAWTHGTTSTAGQGGGPNLMVANIFSPPYGLSVSGRTVNKPAASTSDYYHVDGFYWAMPYDLNSMGTWGQGIATTKGYRYVWLMAPDHPGCQGSISGTLVPVCGGDDGQSLYVAYSNDPGMPPDPSTMRPILPPTNLFSTIGGGAGTMYSLMLPWLVYNADDASNHAYLYTECITNSPGQYNMCLWKANDFDSMFTSVGVAMAADAVFHAFASYQSVYKTGTSTCRSFGTDGTHSDGEPPTYWDSSDNCVTFSKTGTFSNTLTCLGGSGTCTYTPVGGQKFTVGGQDYTIKREDGRAGASPGFYVTLAATSSTGSVLSSPAPVRISAAMTGVFPGPTFLQAAMGYYEDGIVLAYASRGHVPGVGCNANGYPYKGSPCTGTDAGGLHQQYVDLYGYVADSTAAAVAAPFGVRATASGGTATISWYEPPGLPTHSYNVYRSTAAGTKGSLVANTVSTSIVDTPTASSSCTLYFYRVYKVDSGAVERGFRTVSTFVGAGSQFWNQHVTRVCNDGTPYATIDQTFLTAADALLQSTCNCLGRILAWTSTRFGHVKNGSNEISRIYDLGTTFLPRMGDYTPNTPASTTYSATACNGAKPGWVNANDAAVGYYGGSATKRLNNIRQVNGVTWMAAYSASNDATLLGMNYSGSGMLLQHVNGSPGQAKFTVQTAGNPPSAWTLAPPKNLTGSAVNIIAGTFDGAIANVYVEGVAGTPATDPAVEPSPLTGQVGQPANIFLLGSGNVNSNVQMAPDTIARTYNFTTSKAHYTGCDLLVFQSLTPAQIAAVSAFLRTEYP